jgi:Skp family chaperone for outer membrane proteins
MNAATREVCEEDKKAAAEWDAIVSRAQAEEDKKAQAEEDKKAAAEWDAIVSRAQAEAEKERREKERHFDEMLTRALKLAFNE